MKLRNQISRARHSAQAGFTLIEMLAVILILSILMGVLVFSLGTAQETAYEKLTGARLTEISAALGTYESDHGDYPMSHFAESLSSSSSATNLGIESLVQALWKAPLDGLGLTDDILGNVDGDSSNNQQLLEIVDLWGNPIAYFHRADYGKFQTYLTLDGDTGEDVESDVTARRHPVTDRWANHQKFQLISAGADGRFGTDDDICNFKTKAD